MPVACEEVSRYQDCFRVGQLVNACVAGTQKLRWLLSRARAPPSFARELAPGPVRCFIVDRPDSPMLKLPISVEVGRANRIGSGLFLGGIGGCETSTSVSFRNGMELALGWFDTEEEHIPFDVFASCSRASTREGLVQQFEVGDLIDLRQEPVGRGRLLRPVTCQLSNWTAPLRIP